MMRKAMATLVAVGARSAVGAGPHFGVEPAATLPS